MFGKLVIAAFNTQGCFYLEEVDRSSGIKVIGNGVSTGDKLMVTGRMTTIGAERAVRADSITILRQSQLLPKPIGMLNRDMGDWQVQNRGPDNTGMLIRVWGWVTEKSNGWFKIDDGSSDGVRVSTAIVNAPETGDLVVVTGVSSLMLDQGKVYQLILPTSTGSLILLN